jgi:putative SOS response-associated peptidase YedK
MGAGYPQIAKGLPTKSGASCLCNLYSMTKPQHAVRDLARVAKDLTGNLPPLPGIFPDMLAPVIINRAASLGREMQMMRWGFSQPLSREQVKESDNDRVITFRVIDNLPVITWDTRAMPRASS